MKKRRRLRKEFKTVVGCFVGTTIGLAIINGFSDENDDCKFAKSPILSEIYCDENIYEPPLELKNTIEELNIARQQLIQIKHKNDILNTYKKCDTIEDILRRQGELECLGLTDEDKIYKDCPASAEIQHFIYEQSIANNKPFDFLMSIIYAETRGNFNSSGLSIYNPDSNSYDLGYTQQNSLSSLPKFANKYNVSFDDAWYLVQNNDYANICAAFLLIDEINKRHTEYDAYEYAGCYNGWLGWRNYSSSQDYVFNHFSKGYDEVFTNHHYIENNKILDGEKSFNENNIKVMEYAKVTR